MTTDNTRIGAKCYAGRAQVRRAQEDHADGRIEKGLYGDGLQSETIPCPPFNNAYQHLKLDINERRIE